jgi:hypothetical protein
MNTKHLLISGAVLLLLVHISRQAQALAVQKPTVGGQPLNNFLMTDENAVSAPSYGWGYATPSYTGLGNAGIQ